ncbi:MAG TPA: GNAT family N-acetyltransferase [Solirubrobacteraceae bacterium]
MIEVRPARDEQEVVAALDLRHDVFCMEQGVSLADERDGRDGEALHLVALEDGVVTGTCRLLLDGTTVKLARMAVARSRRGLGLARALLGEADAQARALGAQRIALSAQLDARAVYERAGYEAYGEVFVDAGIEHVMMARALA